MAQAFISTGQPNMRATITDLVGATYAQRISTNIRPTAGIVLDNTEAQGYSSPSLLRVTPFGYKSDATAWTTSGTTTSFRLYGWQPYTVPASGEIWWTPTLLTQHTLLFASSPQVASIGDNAANAYFFSGTGAVIADATLTRPAPNIYSPNGTATSSGTIQTPASVLVDIVGSQLVTVDFIAPAPGGSLSVSMGVLWYAV